MEEHDTEVLEDVVILGRAAPEELSDRRQSSCTGAWSKHRGFIRLYPIDPTVGLFSRWSMVNVEVKKNPQDTRYESWKLAAQDQNECVEKIGEYPRNKRATLLHELEDECVKDINEAGRSLGIVKLDEVPSLEFEPWGEEDTVQSRLFEAIEEWRPETREEFNDEIRVEFTCSGCKTQQGYHNKTLLEWGAYMGKSKNNLKDPGELEKFYNIGDKDYRHWIFVGNQANQRSSFIAINLIWLKKDVPIHDTTFTSDSFRKVDDGFKSQRPD